jgi:thioredoxin 2
MVTPALENLARQYAGRLKLVKVNVDESPRVGQRLNVRGVPTLLVLHRGQVVATQVGAAPEPALRSWLEGALSKAEAQSGAQ